MTDKRFRYLIYSLLGQTTTCKSETALKQLAVKLAIDIVHFEVEDVMSFINSHYPEVKIIIGSDGSH